MGKMRRALSSIFSHNPENEVKKAVTASQEAIARMTTGYDGPVGWESYHGMDMREASREQEAFNALPAHVREWYFRHQGDVDVPHFSLISVVKHADDCRFADPDYYAFDGNHPYARYYNFGCPDCDQ